MGVLDEHGQRKYLNWPERTAFRSTCDELEGLGGSFCLTLLYTGCRISEALALKPSSIDASQKTVVFETLKRRKRGVFRTVPIPGFLIDELRQIAEMRGPDERLWPFSRSTAYRIVVERMRKAGLSGSKACPKGLRHSFGIAMASKGVPITMVKKWLGHANLETTEIYLDFVGEDERDQARKIWDES